MSLITKVSFWEDVGYTDGCLEIPPIGAELPEPDYVYTEDLAPSKDRFFSEMQLPVDYQTLFKMSYCQIEYSMNNGENLVFYGWIDDVRLKSDSSGFPMTIVRWHIDYWRTFNQQAQFGFGHVMRGPTALYENSPWFQNYPYRFKTVKEKKRIFNWTSEGRTYGNFENIWWAIVAWNIEGDGKVSETKFITFPVSSPFFVGTVYLKEEGESNPVMAVPRYSLLNATWDDFFGINPKNIVGTWVSPICPATLIWVGGSGSEGDPLVYNLPILSDWEVYDKRDGDNTFRRFQSKINPRMGIFDYSVETFVPPLVSTEENPISITGLNGEKIGDIPFGMSIEKCAWRIVGSSSGMSIEFRFLKSLSEPDKHSNAEGLTINMILPSFDSNENAWSEYLYSGQRQQEIDNRNLRSGWGTAEGIASGIIGGGIIGGMIKGSAGGVPGAIVGAMAGLLMGTIELTVVNDEMQNIQDKYHANQPNGMITGGTGYDNILNGFQPEITIMEFDDMTKSFIQSLKTTTGIVWDYPLENCQELIEDGGPMQIQNLIVAGKIPVAAKNYMRDKFASGVRIVQRGL